MVEVGKQPKMLLVKYSPQGGCSPGEIVLGNDIWLYDDAKA